MLITPAVGYDTLLENGISEDLAYRMMEHAMTVSGLEAVISQIATMHNGAIVINNLAEEWARRGHPAPWKITSG